jgi:HAD superfamily hydrolase (TIGR01509 family)
MTSNDASRKPSDSPELADLTEPRALLFDLDGTLVDTVGLRISAWQEALRRAGIEVDRERLGGYIGSDGRWLAREMARSVGRTMDWAESDAVDQVSGALFDELNRDPRPLPGATELLTALESSRLTFGIATASQPGQVQTSVGALRLPAPPPIVDASHVAKAKPEPDLLLAAAVQLAIPPERCWYVGDSTWDMLAAVRAGMPGIGVTTGASDAAALREAGATAAVASLDALVRELRGRGLLEPAAPDDPGVGRG